MKAKKIIFCVLMLLPLLATLVSLPLLPDSIPAHYGADNTVTRWGSKYETLVFPFMTIAFGLVMLGVSRYAARQEGQGKNNERVCLLIGICSLVVFNMMTGYFLYADFNRVQNLSDVPIDLSRLLLIPLGVSLIIIGNIMPKVKMNSALGLRTTWSAKNETTWKKSQRFGGISLMAVGAVILLICCFTEGLACSLLSLGILILSLPVDIYYTYRVAQRY